MVHGDAGPAGHASERRHSRVAEATDEPLTHRTLQPCRDLRRLESSQPSLNIPSNGRLVQYTGQSEVIMGRLKREDICCPGTGDWLRESRRSRPLGGRPKPRIGASAAVSAGRFGNGGVMRLRRPFGAREAQITLALLAWCDCIASCGNARIALPAAEWPVRTGWTGRPTRGRTLDRRACVSVPHKG
jgi:hypothetical protein